MTNRDYHQLLPIFDNYGLQVTDIKENIEDYDDLEEEGTIYTLYTNIGLSRQAIRRLVGDIMDVFEDRVDGINEQNFRDGSALYRLLVRPPRRRHRR